MEEKKDEYDCIFKISVIGDSGVGKSSLVLRFSDDTFVGSYKTTIGVDFKIRTIELDGKVIKLQIWDTAGTEQFRTICSHYYRNSHGVILVYDTTNLKSFENAKDIWFREIQEKAPPDANKLIIGNKCDLTEKRQVPYELAQELADKLGVPLLEASAKDSTNVFPAFTEMASSILARVGSQSLKSDNHGIFKINDKPSNDETGYFYGYCC